MDSILKCEPRCQLAQTTKAMSLQLLVWGFPSPLSVSKQKITIILKMVLTILSVQK